MNEAAEITISILVLAGAFVAGFSVFPSPTAGSNMNVGYPSESRSERRARLSDERRIKRK